MDSVRSQSLVTAKQAALRLGCTVQHLRLLIRKGQIQARKVGRDWLIEEASLNRPLAYERNMQAPAEVREPAALNLFPELDAGRIVNVASVPQRSPFRYPGGKTWLIPTLRAWFQSMPKNPNTLVEPFAGGAGVSLAAVMEGHVSRAILVELDPDVSVVWRVLFEGDAPLLATELRRFPFDETRVRQALERQPQNDLEHAFQTILRNRVSRGGILAPGAGLVKTGEAGRGMASRWYPETLAKRMEAIHEFRHRFEIHETDGIEVMSQYQDDADTVCFVDPPYPVAGRRLYRCHDLDHRNLFAAMWRLRGPVLATYDHNPEIEDLAKEFHFKTGLIPMKSTHHTKKWELLISRDLSWLAGSLVQFVK
jgi:DNA adenine methylase